MVGVQHETRSRARAQKGKTELCVPTALPLPHIPSRLEGHVLSRLPLIKWPFGPAELRSVAERLLLRSERWSRCVKPDRWSSANLDRFRTRPKLQTEEMQNGKNLEASVSACRTNEVQNYLALIRLHQKIIHCSCHRPSKYGKIENLAQR